MSYKDVSDTQLIKFLEEQGTELCLEAAHRISYYSDKDEYGEKNQPVPQGLLRYPVVFIDNNKIRFSIDTNTTIEVPADQIEGSAEVGCFLVVGDKGKFKVWEPT